MTAPARTMTPRPIARDRTLASRASDGSVYLIVYAPPANLSEVTVGRPPPIDREDLACNVRCRRGSQKHRHFTYFLRCPDPAHGRPAGEPFGVEHAPRGQHGDELRLHVAGRDRVDPHTPRRPLDGHDLGHHVEPGLRDAVGQPLREGHAAVHAAHVDDAAASGRQHPLHDLLGQDEAAVQVEVESVAVVRLGQALRGRHSGLAALLTRMSTRPRAASASAARRRTSSEQERSAGTATAADPSSRTMPAQSSALRELITTRAPSRTYARAMPRPMPLVEPVTTAVLPSSRPLIGSAAQEARHGAVHVAPALDGDGEQPVAEGADSPLTSISGSPSPHHSEWARIPFREAASTVR